MKTYKLSLLILTVGFILSGNLACAQETDEERKIGLIQVAEKPNKVPELLPLVDNKPIKNVILLIGDGTGLAQLASGQYALVGPEGRLHIQTMPVTGFVNTIASDNLITDSAAGATAYSCGIKTYNGAIGVDKDQVPCKTILELAEKKGLSTGLVATSTITHATPASFAAHVKSRSMENEIAADYLDSGSEVILGGGLRHFIPQEEEGSEREDSRNLVEEFKQNGYSFVRNEEELNSTEGEKILGLFGNSELDHSKGEPSLEQMTKKALEVLSRNEDGFFLMVEGSQIDWGGHDNDVDYVIREVESFDKAVKAALDFAVTDGETLVVLTADHETGGMAMQRQLKEGKVLEIVWTTEHHTGIPVPLMAYGPHALEFMGWRDNTYVGRTISRLLQLDDLP